MPAIPTRRRITPRVRLGLAAILLAALGCSPETETGAAGVVSGVRGAELSTEPGGVGSISRSQGSHALVAAQREADGAVWSRLFTSDGSSGWTAQVLGPATPASVTAAEELRLVDRAPEDPEFAAAEGVEADTTGPGKAYGLSFEARVPSYQQLMTPERMQISRMPWLLLGFGEARGWAHPQRVELDWDLDVPESAGLLERLRAAGAAGVLRRPFLGPFEDAALREAPESAPAVLSLEASDPTTPGQPPDWERLDTVVYEPELQRALAVFATGSDRLLMLIDSSGVVAQAVQHGDGGYLLRAAPVDGGAWLAELVSVYGDGYYSTLWRVGPGEGSIPARLEHAALSSGSGEGETESVEADWTLTSDGVCWIGRVQGGRQQIVRFGGEEAASTGAGADWLAVLSEPGEYAAARGEADRSGTGVFPVAGDDGPRWAAGLPFNNEDEALAWLGSRSGSGRLIAVVPAAR